MYTNYCIFTSVCENFSINSFNLCFELCPPIPGGKIIYFFLHVAISAPKLYHRSIFDRDLLILALIFIDSSVQTNILQVCSNFPNFRGQKYKLFYCHKTRILQ